jgi:exodeoxyribonuclease V alpha subunit
MCALRARLVREKPHDDLLVIAALNNSVRAVCRAEMARRQAEGVLGVRIGPMCPWVSVGDPVVMAANHYRFGLANGHIGQVVSLEPLEISWVGVDGPRRVHADFAVDVASAWAITCHRAQGSDAARVVVALDSKTMLTRQWLYTAVTRARQQAILIGPPGLIAAAVARLTRRTTGFGALLHSIGSTRAGLRMARKPHAASSSD